MDEVPLCMLRYDAHIRHNSRRLLAVCALCAKKNIVFVLKHFKVSKHLRLKCSSIGGNVGGTASELGKPYVKIDRLKALLSVHYNCPFLI